MKTYKKVKIYEDGNIESMEISKEDSKKRLSDSGFGSEKGLRYTFFIGTETEINKMIKKYVKNETKHINDNIKEMKNRKAVLKNVVKNLI